MKNRCIILISISLSLFISCNEELKKENNSMFMGDAAHSNFDVSTPILEKPVALWKVATKGPIVASPVVDDTQVFVGSRDKTMYAVDKKSGVVNWTFETTGSIASSVATDADALYFLSYDGNFYALNKKNGTLLWSFETGGESRHEVKDYFDGSFKPDFWDFYLSSPVLKNGVIYFGSSDTHIYALNSKDGKLIWKHKTGGKIHSSPALGDAELVVGSWDSNMYCLDLLTGKENWVYETGKDTAQYVWLGIQASPSISNDTVFFGSRDAKFYALQLKTGDTIWTKDEFHRSWMPSSAAIGKENLYTGSSDSFSFFSIDKKTGNVNYKTLTNSYTFSTPVIDSVMGYIGSTNGRLYGIDTKSGAIKWQYQVDGMANDTMRLFKEDGVIDAVRGQQLITGLNSMPAFNKIFSESFIGVGAIVASPAKSEGVIYIGAMDGNLYALSNPPVK